MLIAYLRRYLRSCRHDSVSVIKNNDGRFALTIFEPIARNVKTLLLTTSYPLTDNTSLVLRVGNVKPNPLCEDAPYALSTKVAVILFTNS
jgi:hypothetical protein